MHTDAAPETGPFGLDAIDLTTIGIDVGSATCHLVVSGVRVERVGGRYAAVASRVIHSSPITFTPYRDDGRIDAIAVQLLVGRELAAAGLDASTVDSGVVILTGTALERDNARAVADALAIYSGEFVSVGAGDILEGILAAHGSGAVERSRRDGPVLNVDIGGGTTKFTWCADGRTGAVAAVDVGARLVAWDEGRRITRIERAGHLLARSVGFDLKVGETLSAETAHLLGEVSARVIVDTVIGGPGDELTAELRRTPPVPQPIAARSIVVSGGVSELLGGGGAPDICDLGPHIADALRSRLAETGRPVVPARQGIRATVIGASQYSVQVSGPTVEADGDILPLRNVAVICVAPALLSGDVDAAAVAAVLGDGLDRLAGGVPPRVAAFIQWDGSATFARLHRLALGLSDGLRPAWEKGDPVVVVCDADVGRVLGHHLRGQLPDYVSLVVLDGVELRDLDYVDIGGDERTGITVTIKSLLFPAV